MMILRVFAVLLLIVQLLDVLLLVRLQRFLLFTMHRHDVGTSTAKTSEGRVVLQEWDAVSCLCSVGF